MLQNKDKMQFNLKLRNLQIYQILFVSESGKLNINFIFISFLKHKRSNIDWVNYKQINLVVTVFNLNIIKLSNMCETFLTVKC